MHRRLYGASYALDGYCCSLAPGDINLDELRAEPNEFTPVLGVFVNDTTALPLPTAPVSTCHRVGSSLLITECFPPSAVKFCAVLLEQLVF